MANEKQEIYKLKIPYLAGGLISETLRPAPISTIIIKHTPGTLSGGASGDYVANAVLESIKLRINGRDFIDWNGRDNIAGQISYGIKAFREFYKQKHKVDMPDEEFHIELPDALPSNVQIDLICKMATVISLQSSGGDHTSYDNASFDISYETKDLVPGKTIIPSIQWGQWSFGTDTGKLIKYLTALSYKLRLLILCTEDNDTPANDVFDTIKIDFPQEQIFDGDMSLLRSQFQQKSQLALSTGMFMLSFKGGRKVNPSQLKFEFYTATGGTAKRIHWHAICY